MPVSSARHHRATQNGQTNRATDAPERTSMVVSAFPPRVDFASLSVRDLLDAREAYHVHLSAMENVVATAIGRYLIHEDDPCAKNPPNGKNAGDSELRRTLTNTVIRPWSWPCVLVFIKSWSPRHQLGDQAIPKRLYLPDGRVVPTCVVLAPPDEELPPPATLRGNASGMIGGGYQCLRVAQGVERIGTLSCLVQREGVYYGLTNKHVAGAKNEPVYSIIRGERRRIGKTEELSIGKRTLSSIFPQWSGERSLVNVDAGLIRLDDVSSWTAQVYGIGEIGEVFDATPETVTLDLIGCPMRAFGGVSGVLEGNIKALFFRYKSLGDYDYIADVLIGPRPSAKSNDGSENAHGKHCLESHPGDSGTLWFYDPPNKNKPSDADRSHGTAEHSTHSRRLHPIAMQWGAERFSLPDGSKSAYGLATFLSTVCRVLDVEITRTWGIGYSEYWGKIAHFAIGFKACDLVDGKLGQLMTKNQERIGFGDETLKQGSAFKVGREGFVPLADVPDYVWVSASKYVRARKFEGQQHFADIDIVPPNRKQSLLDACLNDSKFVSATYWRDCFNGFSELGCGPDEGSLPFRVWQIWEEMVRCLRAGAKSDIARFVAAAGILAHYIGDASMPFHCSWLHHGYLPMKEVDQRKFPVAHDSEEYKAYSKTPQAKIHSIYDEGIMEIDTQAALTGVDEELPESKSIRDDIHSGYEAAVATIELMGEMRRVLSAKEIIAIDDPDLTPKERARKLWSNSKVKKAAIKSLASSTELLARLWASAWKVGGGDKIATHQLLSFNEKTLEDIYRNHDFLPALSLEEMAGKFEPPTRTKVKSAPSITKQSLPLRRTKKRSTSLRRRS